MYDRLSMFACGAYDIVTLQEAYHAAITVQLACFAAPKTVAYLLSC